VKAIVKLGKDDRFTVPIELRWATGREPGDKLVFESFDERTKRMTFRIEKGKVSNG